LLLVALFLDWFGAANAWEAFEALDLVLALLALAVLAAVLGVREGLGPRALLPLGVLLTLVVLVQVVEPPPAVSGADVETGAWLALAGALLVLAGGIMRVARVSIMVDVGRRDVRPRVAAVDRRADTAPATPQAAGAPGVPEPPAADPPAGAVSAADPQATQTFEPLQEDR
jgi:hypothetical protein